MHQKRRTSSIYGGVFSLYWQLPYEWRRQLFRLARPRTFSAWQSARINAEASEDDYSLVSMDKHRCIFIHIPKCAGISITKSLFGNRGGGHKTVIEYQLIFPSQVFESYFKFTFVRNPWDRLVSSFLFLKQHGLTEVDHAWARENLDAFNDFGSFVVHWLTDLSIYSFPHFIPQIQFLKDPITQKLCVDFVGRYETLDQDYSRICEKIGVSAPLGRQNRTSDRREDYRDYYNEHTRRVVAGIYQEDIDMFGYRF